jgi:two-component system, LytTR family, response regulator
MPYRALLVDDERLARSRLRTLLADYPEIQVVAEADCVGSALAAVQWHQPDVVFLDIQMPGQSGFDFLERSSGERHARQFHTIFVTAYDQFAVKAFEVNGLDYLMKPIERERLGRAIRRISDPQRPSQRGKKLDQSDYVFVTGVSGGRFVSVKRIQYILAAGAYSQIFTQDEGKWMLLRSIKAWQERLPPKQFVRIHRSVMVNLDFVDRLQPLPNYSCHVFLRGLKNPLWMSRRYAMVLREQMR